MAGEGYTATGKKGALIRQACVLALLFLFISAADVYLPIVRRNINDRAIGDAKSYVAMYEGKDLRTITTAYRYRILTPLAARLVPTPPRVILQNYQVDDAKIISLKFGIVNLLGITAAGVALFFLLCSFAFTSTEALVGCLFFYTSFYVVTDAGAPLVDAWAYAFIAWGLLCIRYELVVPEALVFTIGMLEKETAILILVCGLLMACNRSEAAKQFGICLPGVLIYVAFRLLLSSGLPSTQATFSVPAGVHAAIANIHIFPLVIDAALTYGMLWPLAINGWNVLRRSATGPIWRLRWLVPLVVVIPFLIGSNFGRIWFLTYPEVIALALVGMRPILRAFPSDSNTMLVKSR